MTRAPHWKRTLAAATIAGGSLIVAAPAAQAEETNLFGLTLRVADQLRHQHQARHDDTWRHHRSGWYDGQHRDTDRHGQRERDRDRHQDRREADQRRPVVIIEQPPVVVHRKPVVVAPKHDGHGHGYGHGGHGLGAANGWDLLGYGKPYAALNVFAGKAQANPHRGGPKIGISISKAMLGDTYGAVVAMRRAIHVDCAALDRVPVDGKLAYELRAVARDLEHIGRHKYNAMFLAASYRVMLGHNVQALHNIRRAQHLGDPNRTTSTLERMILHKLGHHR